MSLPAVVAGTGDPPLLLLHAFAMQPATYQRTIDELAATHRVIVPWWMARGRWSFHGTLDALEATLDGLQVDQVSIVGHSFGGALALGLAARRPERVTSLVLVDALAVSPGRRELARLIVPGRHIARLTSVAGARGFLGTVATRPRNVASAGWWGFSADLTDEIDRVTAAAIPTTVLWARDDWVLAVSLGVVLAERMGATFIEVADPTDRRRVDHDWAYRHPDLFVRTLRAAWA